MRYSRHSIFNSGSLTPTTKKEEIMLSLTSAQTRRALTLLITFHILVISASNYLVQIPFQIWHVHSTWGTLTFPFIFLATDLTVRIFGSWQARKIIFGAMLPALLFSYMVSVVFGDGKFLGFAALSAFNTFVFRIALASFTGYVLGQLLDITIFSRLRRNRKWWVAPAASTILGNMLDTLIFFSVAFYHTTNSFMASHWIQIATLDYCFKLFVSMLLFLPLYGLLLRFLTDKILTTKEQRAVMGM